MFGATSSCEQRRTSLCRADRSLPLPLPLPLPPPLPYYCYGFWLTHVSRFVLRFAPSVFCLAVASRARKLVARWRRSSPLAVRIASNLAGSPLHSAGRGQVGRRKRRRTKPVSGCCRQTMRLQTTPHAQESAQRAFFDSFLGAHSPYTTLPPPPPPLRVVLCCAQWRRSTSSRSGRSVSASSAASSTSGGSSPRSR
jgi:hypothetical protein